MREFKCDGFRMTSVLELAKKSTDHPAVFNQSFVSSNPVLPVPGLDEIKFQTATVAFKDSTDGLQYEWVIEFTCGTIPDDSLEHLFPGGFVGLNMYSRTGPTDSTNLQEMVDTVDSLGLKWVMDDWGWGFHIVPHSSACEYNPPDVQEYACTDGMCQEVAWGYGTNSTTCAATCV